METAASLPAATARTARSAPDTPSPPAKTPGTFVASVAGSTRMPRREICTALDRSPLASTVWPMAAMTVVASSVNAEPGTGTGRARPDSSGAPSAMRVHVSRSVPEADRSRPHRRHQRLERDAFGLRGLHFRHEARHLAPRAPVEDRDSARAEAHGRARRVHRRVAAAEHEHVVADVGGRPLATPSRNASAGSASSSPGHSSPREPCAPIARKTASNSRRRSSSVMSVPRRRPMRNSPPSWRMTSISWSSTSWGSRNAGMP